MTPELLSVHALHDVSSMSRNASNRVTTASSSALPLWTAGCQSPSILCFKTANDTIPGSIPEPSFLAPFCRAFSRSKWRCWSSAQASSMIMRLSVDRAFGKAKLSTVLVRNPIQ